MRHDRESSSGTGPGTGPGTDSGSDSAAVLMEDLEARFPIAAHGMDRTRALPAALASLDRGLARNLSRLPHESIDRPGSGRTLYGSDWQHEPGQGRRSATMTRSHEDTSASRSTTTMRRETAADAPASRLRSLSASVSMPPAPLASLSASLSVSLLATLLATSLAGAQGDGDEGAMQECGVPCDGAGCLPQYHVRLIAKVGDSIIGAGLWDDRFWYANGGASFVGKASWNASGEIAFTRNVGGVPRGAVWLPQAAYGLAAGGAAHRDRVPVLRAGADRVSVGGFVRRVGEEHFARIPGVHVRLHPCRDGAGARGDEP